VTQQGGVVKAVRKKDTYGIWRNLCAGFLCFLLVTDPAECILTQAAKMQSHVYCLCPGKPIKDQVPKKASHGGTFFLAHTKIIDPLGKKSKRSLPHTIYKN